MSGTAPRRVVVFDRIDANRRNSRLMLGIFGVALLPVVGLLSSYLHLDRDVPARPDGFHEGSPKWARRIFGVGGGHRFRSCCQWRCMYSTVMPTGSRCGWQRPGRWKATGRGDFGIRSRGSPSARDCLSEVVRCRDGRSKRLSVGLDPGRSSIVVTRGLLSLLTPREMEGVLAHEISHIGNQDIRLNTTVAAMGAVLRLPFRLLTAPIRFLFHVHWLLGFAALLLFFRMLLLLSGITDLRYLDEFDPSGQLRTIALVQIGVVLYTFLVAPLIGLLLPLAISRQRELLADADAARLTLNPPSLARALAKLTGGANGPMKGSHAMAHLYIVDPPGAGGWWKGIVSTHPPVGERIELLAGMGDGILPEAVEGREPEARDLSRDVSVPPGKQDSEPGVLEGEPKAGFLDASLYGIAAGSVAIAVLTVANCLFLVLGSGNYRTGMITAFQPPAALAAGFSARRGGVSGLMAMGFAVLVFLFSWVLYAPLLPFMPDSTLDPLRWILWSLFSDIAVVFMAAAAGASLDRWAAWVRGVFDNLLKRFG